MLADDILDLLAANGVGTVGTTLFSTAIPATIENGTWVMVRTGAQEPNHYIDTMSVILSFWHRNKSTTAGYAILKDILYELHRRANYTVGNYLVYFSYAVSDIEVLDKDAESRKLMKLDVNFIYRDTLVVS